MKRTTWLGLGLIFAALGGATFACSSSSSGGGSGGSGGGGGAIVGGTGGGGTTGTGATGSGATGGTGGTTAKSMLGSACVNDGECGAGLKCLLPSGTEWEGQGPAKGYCSADCAAQQDICQQFSANGICLGFDNGSAWCVEGCSFGPSGTAQFDSNKCHGREEIACTPLLGSTAGGDCGPPNYDCPKGEACATDNKCHPVVPACIPRCNSDLDCGGSKCDLDKGTCTSSPSTGKALGEECTYDEDAGTDDCAGLCIGVGENTRSCGSTCTLAAQPSCGWDDPNQPAPSWCMYLTSAAYDADGGVGDLGLCLQFCNCNSDCKNPNTICHDFGSDSNATSLKGYLKQSGVCLGPEMPEGGMDPGIACGASDAGTD